MARKYIKIPIPLEEADDFYQDWIRAKKQTAESPNIIVDKRYDPNMPFGEAMNKMIAPPNTSGMKPTWTQKTRERYRACLQPHLEVYKQAIDKINRSAQEKYDDQTFEYVSRNLGFNAFSGLFNAFNNDKEVRVRYSYKGRNIVTGGDKVARAIRITFWLSFAWDTSNYLNKRYTANQRDYRDFDEQTQIFFKKVNQCRKENPYDSWILKTLEEQYYDQIIFYPYIQHPHRWLVLPVE